MKTSKPLKIVLDTNVLLVSLSNNFKYARIFDAFLAQKFILAISVEIIQEYEEIAARRYHADYIDASFDMIIHSPNVIRQDVYFNWNLITQDPDDNKFVDVAVATNADFIVTNDKHFKILETIDFPKIEAITAEEFLEILASL
jgi:putative PIN family toxin of toxin-antitoxin system